MLILVIGGVRSGKSRFALSLCSQYVRVAYIATARPEDEETRARIARHRQERPADWVTIEEPLDICEAVQRQASVAETILLDCLTMWLSNFCFERRDWAQEGIEQAACDEIGRLSGAAARCRLVVVTNEVGCGIVPAYPAGRMFRDLLGLVNQRIAREAEVVYQVVAGIDIPIKGVAAHGAKEA